MRRKKLAAVFLVMLAAFVGGCGGEEEAGSTAAGQPWAKTSSGEADTITPDDETEDEKRD